MDHDHRTGLERGYLCRRCNHMTERHVPVWTRWRNGWNPTTLLGHVEVYLNIYGRPVVDTAVDEDELREAINRLPPVT